MKILLIDHDRHEAEMLAMVLRESGYLVDIILDGVKGEAQAISQPYDLVILDWLLPGRSGPQLIINLRESGALVPVFMLTGRGAKQDHIDALNCGADDYLVKPCSLDILLARIGALLRRAQAGAEMAMGPALKVGSLKLYARQRAAFIGEKRLDLRAKEFQFLEMLAELEGMVVSRTAIAERIWSNVYLSDDVLNTTLTTLRRKVREASPPDGPDFEIQTIRGMGYRLVRDESESSSASFERRQSGRYREQ